MILTSYHKYRYKNQLQVSGYIYLGKGSKLVLENGASLVIDGSLIMKDYCKLEIKKNGVVKMGKNCFFNDFTSIVIHSSLIIGNNLKCGEGIKIYDHDHLIIDGKILDSKYLSQEIRIGNEVWLGNYVNILKGSSIGNNVIVGAMGLVNSQLSDKTIYAGIPVKAIRKLEVG